MASKPNSQQTLLVQAQRVQLNAHAPYSHFQVGAALLDEAGNTYAGCNVENAAYPLGQCAEANAIGAMVAAGGKSIREILIASPNAEPCPPCGGCRQKIAEFASADTLVHLATHDGQITSMRISELLPLSFSLRPSV
jgi:cytidine deaminase